MLRRCFFVALTVLLCVFSSSAYDVITTLDNSTIQAIVSEITPTSVKYRKAANPKGPVYTIEIEKVKTIKYQNGTKDVFNEEPAPSVTPNNQVAEEKQPAQATAQPTPQPAANNSSNPQNTGMSDAELLQLYTLSQYTDNSKTGKTTLDSMVDYQKYEKQAKKYRKIAWIVGGGLAVVGIFTTTLALSNSDSEYVTLGGIVGGVFMGTGIGLCIGYNIKANKAAKMAKEFKSYTLFEQEIFSGKNQKLSCGLNLFSHRQYKPNALGLSLSYSF